ncbi:ATP synthase [Defluviimonas sp. 20V17]|uniref:H-type lectin domain-containing protein n=1 Tax=Allgaiera indica TaxID=765699 RepID=A0AAN4UPI0_9RHOB|nr:H-type lectin domain-containing protein [Allgaiera indica]KDB03781.1 ATP synthase [Defluviimonas sp. 20V17]GHD99947.1 hypothetical protein GCM10008024_09700 [Allgaiera indica]SDW40075.1 H-type lectin domain-containing protein [Allgaiera indica]
MKKFRGTLIGIDQGSALLFSDFEDGGQMWTGSGPRAVRIQARFSESFRTPPVVQASISMWDMDRATNMRADLSAEEITAEGFVLVFSTWGDSRVARIRADWTAIGELEDPDAWQVD